ncbi:uncharacterized protein MJAP1_003193 [Malassezia japonica]|uniref:Uncharacterized protein n=1 Tax=Malassezia japonica TaxID=223818 RepID=A0AAF0F8F7_9BASI|nr:uncharacterized protein MJAP1_003193 [Malassezia japonica]WFD40207.1 hypothetical protein MJAP1_003193 [Malassezia japonica]
MATVGDYIGLALILALVYAIYQGFHNSGDVKQALSEKKKELKAKGVNISSEGISIRSNRAAMDRASYIDATQKKFTEGGQYLAEHSNALKFGKQSE